MKRVFLILMIYCLTLTGCSAQVEEHSAAASKMEADFTAAIESARNDELNEGFPVLTTLDDDYISTSLGINGEDVETCAVAVSTVSVQAYCVALVRPMDGKEEEVHEGLLRFIAMQTQNFESYLEDQYMIAASTQLGQLSDGTYLMVMCENCGDVYAAIEDTLESQV